MPISKSQEICDCECHISDNVAHVAPCCCIHNYKRNCPHCEDEFDKLVTDQMH
jgi:hypothetical protein